MGSCLEAARSNLASPDKGSIRQFFDHIAGRYDLLNSVLSLQLDESWRRNAVDLLLRDNAQGEKAILDLGVGTGKFLKRFLEKKEWSRAVGVDFANEMLKRARTNLPEGCELIQADIHDLPFESESFDLVVSSFTLRSVKDRGQFFSEVRRILKSRGKLGFLCLTRPTSLMMRALYAPYLKFYLPLLGGIVSADRNAYKFLSESIQAFPSPSEIGKELESAGFRDIVTTPFSFGISTLIQGRK